MFSRELAVLVCGGLAATLLAGCGRDDVADGFPDGACVVFSSTGDTGADATIGKADCAGHHTHVVVSWKSGANADCGAGLDFFLTPDGRLCLRPDPGASPAPSAQSLTPGRRPRAGPEAGAGTASASAGAGA